MDAEEESLKFLHPTFRMLGYGNFVRDFVLAISFDFSQDQS